MNKMDVAAELIQMCVEDMIDARTKVEFKNENIEVVEEQTGSGYRVTKIVRNDEGGIRLVIIPE